MTDRADFDQALDDLRFSEAEALADAADAEAAEGLRRELEERRAGAEARAQERYQQIIRLSGERRYAELTELVHDPTTRRLLELLPEASRERAEVHLKAVERWEERRRETSLRRLAEARQALQGLDLGLARGLVNKVDSRFLTEEERADRDQLLLDISARAMELESLEESGRELWEEHRPERPDDSRPWWRRWFG